MWRDENWDNPYGAVYGCEKCGHICLYQPRKVFEAGADTMLKSLEPLIRKIAPSSKELDIYSAPKPRATK